MNLFGKKKAAPSAAPKLADAIALLKTTSDNLEKREQHLLREKEQARVEGAAKLKAKDKQGALFFLRRMRLYEGQIAALYGKRANIDTQVLALQGAAVDKAVIAAMQAAHLATKASVSEQDVDRVQDLMDDLRDARAMASDISDALAAPLVEGEEEEDEEALLAAFEKQEEETTTTTTTTTTATTTTKVADADAEAAGLDLPAVPARPVPVPAATTTATTAKKDKDTDEFRALEAMMGI